MSRTPRRSRHLGRHAPSSARAAHVASGVDPAAGLRALVEEGIVAAAALNARNDLELAAASTQRLGALTSGMWRALSRELATAAERLDRSTMERMDDIQRRAAVLQVEADDVFRAGEAAAHLAEHRDTLETLLGPDDDGRRLLGPNLLFGFNLDADDADDDDDADDADHEADADDDDDDGESAPHPVRVTLFLWPEPLTPAVVSIVPSLPGGALETAEDVALDLGLARRRCCSLRSARPAGYLPTA